MKTIITIIRAAIGWHFLYEGLIKLFVDKWSAEAYLTNTHGFLSGFYHWLAASPVRLEVVDFLNVWGLTLIGLALFLGVCARWASVAGTLLLALYYFAYPPFGISLLGGDGTVYIINQLFIEAVILIFLFCYKGKGYGLDDLVRLRRRRDGARSVSADVNTPVSTGDNTRREVLKDLAALPVLGLFGWGAYRSGKIYGVDTLSGATIQINRVALSELKGELPKGKLGNHELSRLIMGGNLIGGWAHARDLIYAGALFKAYNTEKKIFETLILCEQAGINCINIGFPTIQTMVKYKKLTGSKIKVITQVGITEKSEDIYENVTTAIDNGMDMIQLQGNWCDWLVRDNRLEVIDGLMNRIRSNGIVAGMGAHTIDSFVICEENGIIPDYYMKTMHHDNYWSAHPRENRKPFEVDGAHSNDHNMFHDNCFCPFPDRTVEFVNRAKVPVMGFKVLAAGAIHPKDGFKWAFENGADFICVGMFDFQVVDDVNICMDVLQNLQNRKRGWYA
ncbi:MAG: DoxX family membrane protein [Bacteroidales bacterium]|jgi:uncharacterized membrane protein YphA (DoxX/SURF4 family)|nr:DoxX family membrane protein [Bacteroidales bacterium]